GLHSLVLFYPFIWLTIHVLKWKLFEDFPPNKRRRQQNSFLNVPSLSYCSRGWYRFDIALFCPYTWLVLWLEMSESRIWTAADIFVSHCTCVCVCARACVCVYCRRVTHVSRSVLFFCAHITLIPQKNVT